MLSTSLTPWKSSFSLVTITETLVDNEPENGYGVIGNAISIGIYLILDRIRLDHRFVCAT